MEEDKSPFTEHLTELRDRLIKSFIAIVIGFAAAFAFKERIFDILAAPLIQALGTEGNMVYTGLPEAFFTYLKTCLLAGAMAASPYLIYHFWMFVAPGLYEKERHVLIPIVLLSSVFFVGGALFGYFIVFPYGFDFFLGFNTDHLKALPSMKEYFSFASKLLFAFGLVFELPLVLTSMAKLGIVSVDFLKKNRKYALLLFFIGSAILTPPDVVTQVMMAFPLMLLYELSIIGAKIFGKKDLDEDLDG